MPASKTRPQQALKSFSYTTLCIRLAAAGALLAVISVPAQTTNMAVLRELRVACLESFNTAKLRLDDLHGFLAQQAEHERDAAGQVFALQQSAASAKRRNSELLQQVRRCTNLLSRTQTSVEKATTSYRAALDSMPTGEAWATDGSAALNELRRAADAAPRDAWKHKRVKEIEAEFVDTLRQWRAARRSMEQASFDLELRAAPSAFRRVADQIESALAELKALENQLAERQAALEKLAKQSEQWGAAISALEKVEEQALELAQDTGRLAADQESLRRSLETEQQALAKGAETLDLVKKRFSADLKVINELLDSASERTATLAKGLER